MGENHINIFYLLFATGLVFLMQAGFTCLEAGLTRPKNSINVAIKNLADFVIATLIFWLVGYGIMFGDSVLGLFGTSKFAVPSDAAPLELSFFLFQAVFCGTAATIVSGAIAERTKFGVYLAISAAIGTLIYPVAGHLVWNGDGLLAQLGFVDFAGSTVVHSVGGWVALAGVIVVGARKGRFDEHGNAQSMTPWSLPMSVLGCVILCFGWLGFNGGSTLELSAAVPMIVLNTLLAATAGGIAALGLAARTDGLIRAEPIVNGVLAGLVGTTASCHCVGALAAIAIGGSSGMVMFAVARLLLRLRLDDVIGAVPVHLAAGIWGTMCVALFGSLKVMGTELGRLELLWVQLRGIVIVGCWTFGTAFLVFKLADRLMCVRVSEDDEEIGLNMAEHGEGADVIDLVPNESYATLAHQTSDIRDAS